MRIRIHFSKIGYACFISHIDLPMLFGRAARRAELRAELTQGFSPHPRLALASPLPVGVAGLCEPADFWFDNWNESSLKKWRASLPEGIDIIHAEETSGISLHKLCSAASYTFELLSDISAYDASIALKSAMNKLDAFLKVDFTDKKILLSVKNIEQGGASYMVKSLIAVSAVEDWSDLRVTRTSIGRWDSDKERVVSLMEEAL